MQHYIYKLTLLIIIIYAGITQARYQPFVLSSTSNNNIESVTEQVKQKLLKHKYKLVGEYSPQESVNILVLTHPLLLKTATQSKNIGASFASAQRVAITHYQEKIQVSFFNPVYVAIAYHENPDNYRKIKQNLIAILGFEKEFGAKNGLSKRKLTHYHYAPGMEYFDDFYKLARYASHSAAITAVQTALAANAGGAYRVYKISIPKHKRIIYGVELTDGFSADKKIITTIDKKPLKHSAHFPYEIMIDNKEVIALHPRFRIALSWPMLKMIGRVSFYKIMKAPAHIEKSLILASGGVTTIKAKETEAPDPAFDDSFDF